MSRLDKERQKILEPKRLQSSKEALEKLGFIVEVIGTTELNFYHKGQIVKFFPYSGWHTGKTINDGRGYKKLMKQLIKE